MPSKPTSTARPPHWRSDEDRVEIVLFSCGHGDTILIRLAGPKWALIDCNLPDSTAFDRFVEFLNDLDIRRLVFVALTHPDIDHYAGLADVLKHFHKDRQGVDHFYDSGINYEEVLQSLEAIGRPPEEVREFYRLISTVENLQISAHRVDDKRQPIVVSGTPMQFTPIAPAESCVLSSARRALRSLPPGVGSNRLSLVFIMTIETTGDYRHFLLPGDADSNSLNTAVRLWRESHKEDPGAFSVIKVSHHGSANGHSRDVCEQHPADESYVAVISVGNKYKLPRKSVLLDYLKKNWTVLSTTTKQSGHRTNLLLDQFGERTRHEALVHQSHDIVVSWSDEHGLNWQPDWARITLREAQDVYV